MFIIFILLKQNYWISSQVRQHLLSYYIDKTNMENDCAFANLEDKYTFRLDKMAIASSRWMCRTLPIQGRMYTQLPILSIYVLLVENRIPKKFSVSIFILISFQALFRVFWKLKVSPPGAFRWIFWHGRIVSDQVQVRFHIQTYFLVQICKNIDISLPFTAYLYPIK
jgi:hypothetical protein